jgi:hypothetical protein
MRCCISIFMLTVSHFSIFVPDAEAFLWGRGRKAKVTQISCVNEAVLQAKGLGQCRDISNDNVKSASLAIFQCLEKRYGRNDMSRCDPHKLFSFQKCLSTENADDNVLTHIELLNRRVIVMCFLIHDTEVSRYIGRTTQDLQANLDGLEKMRERSSVPSAVKGKYNTIYKKQFCQMQKRSTPFAQALKGSLISFETWSERVG